MKKIKFNGNSTVASEQERYMKHHFKFLGVKKPEQLAQSKEILSESKKSLSANYSRKSTTTTIKKRENTNI